MAQAMDGAIPVPALLNATPIEVAGKVVQPVARMQKWQIGSDGGGAAFVHLSPHALHVQAGDKTYTVSIVDPDHALLKQLFYWGAVMSGVCLLMMTLTWILSFRQK